jgi:hypothetical protein
MIASIYKHGPRWVLVLTKEHTFRNAIRSYFTSESDAIEAARHVGATIRR